MSDFPNRKSLCHILKITWMCLEKEQLTAHYRSTAEEFPEEHTRQRSSLAEQAAAKAHRSIFHQWQLQKQTKNGLIIFLCFCYSQWLLTVFILNYTGSQPNKHSFKISNRQREPKSCCFLPHILQHQLRHHMRKFSQVTHAGLLKQNTRMQMPREKILGAGSRWKGSNLKKLHLRAQGCLAKVGKHLVAVETAASSTTVLVSASLP